MTFAFSNNGAASVEATRRAVNAALLSTGYSCKTVSWDDVSRGTVFGTLSSLGANITDTYLKARDGTKLFTVRSDNWNEKLGLVRAEDIALLIGNCDRSDTLQNITLQQFLSNPAALGAGYTGIQRHVRLADTDPNKMVSIRFQTVFLPVSADASGRGRMQFAAEAYNYATRSDQDPRNLILLATTQGLSVQADGAGAKRLLLHAGLPPFVNEYWLEAESSAHSVGGEQRESAAEREDALRRGKATSEVIGIKAMGTRFNVLMTIQIPLVQSQQSSLFGGTSLFGGSGFGAQPSSVFGGFGASTFGSKPGSGLFGASQAQPQNTFSFGKSTSGANGVFGPGYGQSSASVGSSFGSGSVASPSANAASSTPFGAPAVGFGGSVSPSKDPGSTFSAGASTQLTPQADGAPNGGALGSSGSTTASPVSAPAVPAAVFGASPVVPSAVTFGASPATAVVVDKNDPSSVFGPAAAAARLRAQGLVHLSSAQGRASAARVSRGDFYARYTGLTVKEPRRNDAEHITVTCVLYNTVVGGIPNEADVLAAVADMDKLYAACTASGRLADAAFSFMTPELSSFDVVKINAKSWNMPPVMHQPPGANRGPNIFSTMQHPHTFANASGSARDIVMAKYSQLEFTPFLTANAMLELKLLTFGALQADSMRVVLGSKFDEIAFRINSGDAFGAKALLPELKLLIQGSLSLQ